MKAKDIIISDHSLESEAGKIFLIEMYSQSCAHLRGYIDLRFKHFTTYIAIMVLLAAAIKGTSTPLLRAGISLCEFSISVLFYLLDLRTQEYLFQQSSICNIIELKFKSLFPTTFLLIHNHTRPKKKVKASLITKLLFFLFMLMWAFVTTYFIIKNFRVHSPSITQEFFRYL